MSDPPLFVWCIKASLLKEEKKRCLIITFVDLCTFWLPSLLGTRHGHYQATTVQTQALICTGNSLGSARSRTSLLELAGGNNGGDKPEKKERG